ncbi:MAG: HesA/MoeB/ThiF family protein, partial [Bacteroidia bacterium]|nr:HesA/MoeB/ThiF family protein [Bacteroidia bacterium]
KASSVLIIGIGGLGCTVAQLLTTSGVGKIGLLDGDSVDLSNLQRQVLFNQNDIGKPKVDIAKNKLTVLNPNVELDAFNFFLNNENVINLFLDYDVIVDCTDDIETKILTNEHAIKCNKPLVYAALHKYEGQVTTFNYNGSASYTDLFPSIKKMQDIPQCSEVGVYSILPNLIASLQTNEVIKIILELGNILSGQLLTYNTLTNNFYMISYDKV